MQVLNFMYLPFRYRTTTTSNHSAGKVCIHYLLQPPQSQQLHSSVNFCTCMTLFCSNQVKIRAIINYLVTCSLILLVFSKFAILWMNSINNRQFYPITRHSIKEKSSVLSCNQLWVTALKILHKPLYPLHIDVHSTSQCFIFLRSESKLTLTASVGLYFFI